MRQVPLASSAGEGDLGGEAGYPLKKLIRITERDLKPVRAQNFPLSPRAGKGGADRKSDGDRGKVRSILPHSSAG